ncbi:signal transduction histidine kinase [Pedobacter sp. UYP30]|uniref:ATP-binding protein n=1 Tax=Pedobacter sp. UYP30 TaxID=1756400 RepID=UPI003390B62E
MSLMSRGLQRKIFKSVKGKVILGFICAFFALLLAGYVSKFAFGKMLSVVEEISQPNARLRIVNDLTHKIARLDQLQRKEAFDNDGNDNFLTESKRLRLSLDTLRSLYANDSAQLERIKSLKKLLRDRDKQFLAYLKVRENLVNTKSFSEDVSKISGLVSKQSRQADSAVLITQTTTSTTTVGPDDEKKSRGFLSKLFGKKKADAYKIINEEFKVKRDTVNPKAEDSLLNSMESALRSIAKTQRLKGQKFLQQESELAVASNTLTRQMLKILKEVEAQAVQQMDLNGRQAKQVVNASVAQITAILVVFFFLTIVLMYLILSDITKSNRYRKALELARDEAEYHGKAKQRFLSNMSHEIRTPLQAILGYSELISLQDIPRKKDINAIYQSSVHLLQIVNEILDYNRIISGEFTFNNHIFRMQDLLDEVVSVILPLAEQKSLKLSTHVDTPGVEFVKGDAFRLKQVLYNIIGNAVKFTFDGEIKLSVSAKKQNEHVHLNFIIEDTGIGFAETEIDTIFNEFEQVESPEKYVVNQTGTGLGLSIVKSLVENQGGRIHVKSKPGIGTIFSVFLKFESAEEEIPDSLELKNYKISTKQTVWVIDDDKLILDLCGLIFERNKIPYKCFNEITEILNEQPVDSLAFVLVDMRLPEMTGLELCKILKKKLPPHVRFYAITAQVLPDERDLVLKEGFEGLIMKPFRAVDLLSIFDNVDMDDLKPELDFSNIEKMTFGDQQMLKKILTTCRLDSLADAKQLTIFLEENNQADARLIVHRLAGRMAQIGSKTLATSFRLLEIDIAEIGLTISIKNEVVNQLAKLDEVLALLDGMERAPADE